MNVTAKKILQISTFSVFFLLILAYAFFRSQGLIFGVQIRNVNIKSGARITSSVQEIKGNAKNAVHLTLDGREISIDENGNFDETIALLPGYNIMNITAKDKFGYVDEKNYQLMYTAL